MTTRSTEPWVLGINGSHNGSYCLLRGAEICVAVQEERLTGVKRARVSGARPALALRYCLETAGIGIEDLSLVAISSQRPAAASENDLRLNPDFRAVAKLPIKVVPHHLAHAASAFATAGCPEAAVLVVDGLGSPTADHPDLSPAAVVGPREGGWEHLSLFHARGTTIRPIETHTVAGVRHRPDAGMRDFFTLGGMFAAVAQQVFGDDTEAGKVMGLAAYGNADAIPAREFVVWDGRRLHFPNRVQARFRFTARWPDAHDAYADLAASAQRALESVLLPIAQHLGARTGAKVLCYSGGVALNGIANELIRREAGFTDVHVFPAAEDSGVAVGAAYLGLWDLVPRRPARIRVDAPGRTYGSDEIERAIATTPGIAARTPDDLLGEVVDRLAAGQIGAWFQGGSELGPRALGQRSIICSPIGADVKHTVNARVKFRETFRPFAPAVLHDEAEAWFDFQGTDTDSPFMLRVLPFRPSAAAVVPAVVHADGTGRVQTLTRAANGVFYDLVERFAARTGVPMLLNTSLNVRGEPIAERPEDALWCLLGTGLDFCVVHDRLVTKSDHGAGLLRLVPKILADEFLAPVARPHLDGKRGAVLRTSTPWGPAEIRLPARLFAILMAIDGRRDAGEIHRVLDDRPLDDFARDLLLLRRVSAIVLS